MKMEMLSNEVKDHLQEVIIPFWKKLRDDEYGGYYGAMNFDLEVDKSAIKGCILNSRILWFFSNAYLLLKDESLLLEATHAFQFLKNYCLDKENGGIYWSLAYDGSVVDATKHTYNQAFAVYALASYYDASKEVEALSLAGELHDIIEKRCKDQFGYMEAFDISFHPVSNEKLSENGVMAEKTMNTLLHVMEAYTELYRVGQEEEVASQIKAILNLVERKVYNWQKQRQEVFFDKEWNSLIDLHSYGHDIETAWLVDRACDILGDKALSVRMESITKSLSQHVFQRAYVEHSILNECEDGVDDTTRIWWVQAEAMVGFLNRYQKDSTKTEYFEAVTDIWNYIKTYFIDDRANSEWFWSVDEHGNPNSEKFIVEPWKCPYHNGRMCIEVIRRISGSDEIR